MSQLHCNSTFFREWTNSSEGVSSAEIQMDSSRGGSDDRNQGKKSDKGRRIWTEYEEQKLLVAMKEIVTQGWKADNGFKAGYMKKLEGALAKLLPGSAIQANPHINSKATAWKRTYYALSSVLNQSGVGFNLNGTFMVDCDAAKWDSMILTDPNAAKLRGKSWPFYYDWLEIFGKDRANGERAEDVLEAVNALEREFATIDEDYVPGDYHINLDHILTPESEDNTVSQPEQVEKVPNSKGKKRKTTNEGIDKVCVLLGEISSNANKRLEILSSRIGYEYDLGKARMGIYEKLGNIPELSMNDKFSVCELLGSSVEKLEIFMGLPESARAQYVYHLLNPM